MLLATAVVIAVPIGVVWLLRDEGIVTSSWACLVLAVALSLFVSVTANACWRRCPGAADLTFSELLLWGWVRRLYVDRQVARASARLGLAGGAATAPSANGAAEALEEATKEERARLLTQLAMALDAQDPYLDGHSRRVARHATLIARKMGLPAYEVKRIRLAALLHDVGKLRVPSGVLNKPSRLTPEEYELVKRHVTDGAQMVSCLEDDELTAIVRHHHERLDGRGYPGGLQGEQIPLGARIVAVADTFDAITTARPYRPASLHKRAFDTLAQESRTQFDPTAVRAFVRCYSARRVLAFWAALAAVWQRALTWPQARGYFQRGVSFRNVGASTAATAAIAAIAVAVPLGLSRAAHHSPAHAAVLAAETGAPEALLPAGGAPGSGGGSASLGGGVFALDSPLAPLALVAGGNPAGGAVANPLSTFLVAGPAGLFSPATALTGASLGIGGPAGLGGGLGGGGFLLGPGGTLLPGGGGGGGYVFPIGGGPGGSAPLMPGPQAITPTPTAPTASGPTTPASTVVTLPSNPVTTTTTTTPTPPTPVTTPVTVQPTSGGSGSNSTPPSPPSPPPPPPTPPSPPPPPTPTPPVDQCHESGYARFALASAAACGDGGGYGDRGGDGGYGNYGGDGGYGHHRYHGEDDH